MSIFSSIIDAGKKLIGGGGGTVIGGLLGGPAGAMAGSTLGSVVSGAGKVALPALKRVLPGVGQVAAGAAGGYFGGMMAGGQPRRRRRSRGFSAHDVRQTRRMLAMLKTVERDCPRRRSSPAPRSCK